MLTIRATRLPPSFRIEVPAGDREMAKLAESLGEYLAARGYLVSTTRDRAEGLVTFSFNRMLEMQLPVCPPLARAPHRPRRS